MDRKQLDESLKPFFKGCEDAGKRITNYCLQDTIPGDASTSFVLQVTAPWVEDMECNQALDFLFDVLFKTTEETIREKIFAILVLDSKEQLHCASEAGEFK